MGCLLESLHTTKKVEIRSSLVYKYIGMTCSFVIQNCIAHTTCIPLKRHFSLTSSRSSTLLSKCPPGSWDLVTSEGGQGKHNLLRMDHLELLLYFSSKDLMLLNNRWNFHLPTTNHWFLNTGLVN